MMMKQIIALACIEPSLLRNTKDVFNLGIINGGTSAGHCMAIFDPFAPLTE